jgi:hypothetical protein
VWPAEPTVPPLRGELPEPRKFPVRPMSLPSDPCMCTFVGLVVQLLVRSGTRVK